VSDTSGGPGWWLASDGRWYPPEQHPRFGAPRSPYTAPTGSPYATPTGSPYAAPTGSPYGAPTGPSYPYPAPGSFGSPWAGGPRTSGLAIASLVCSLGAFVLAGIPSVVGIILGFVARSQIRRSGGTKTGAGLALAGIIVGFAEIALVVVLIVALVLVVQSDSRKLQIAGAPGYSTFAGPTGQPMVEGRPWGVACEPIVFQAGDGVPNAIYTEMQEVVLAARAAGVDVTLATRQDRWYPTSLYPSGLTNGKVQFVSVLSSTATPPLLGFDQPEHIQFSWNARPTADKTHEIVTYLQAVLYLKVLTDPAVVRRSVRQLIAFSQGVAGSSVAQSGIVDGSSADGFTDQDYGAMRLMSGCRPPG
jgi:uncharacterized protein DUF4190